MNHSIKSTFLILLIALSYDAINAAVLSDQKFLPLYNSRSAYTPAAAFGNGVFITAWQSGRLQPGDLRNGPVYRSILVFCRADTMGDVLDSVPVVISDTTDLKESPKIVFGGNQFLLVWQDFRNGDDWDVYGARIGSDGSVLDHDGFLISGGAHNQACPRVAWDGIHFSVVWQDARSGMKYETYMARITPNGSVLDANGILVATGISNCMTPALAPAGEGIDSVLIFSVGTIGNFNAWYPTSSNTTGIFVSNGITGTSPAYQITQSSNISPGGGTFPIALAKGAGGYLLAWQNEMPFGRGNSMIKNNMAIFNNNIQRTKDLHIGLYAVDVKRIMNPDVVWDGNNYAAVWHEQVTRSNKDTAYDKVCAAIISDTGKMMEPEILIAGTAGAPALNACVAAAKGGKKWIAYEQQPDVAGAPIKIAYRMLTDQISSRTETLKRERSTKISLFPNPFNPSVAITIHSCSNEIELKIYDLQGRMVADLSSQVGNSVSRGRTVLWNAARKSSSVYVICLKAENGEFREKMVFSK